MVYYIGRLGVIMLICLPAYLLVRRPWRYDPKREIVLGIFALFMAGLLSLALQGTYAAPWEMLQSAAQRLRTGEEINLIPFYTIVTFWKYAGRDAQLVNLAGNVVMFLPWGFGLPLLWKKFQSPWAVGAASLLLTLFIETTQLFIRRNMDVDDLLLNFLGGCLGGLVYLLMRKVFPKANELAK